MFSKPNTPRRCAPPLSRGDRNLRQRRSPLERGAHRAGCGWVSVPASIQRGGILQTRPCSRLRMCGVARKLAPTNTLRGFPAFLGTSQISTAPWNYWSLVFPSVGPVLAPTKRANPDAIPNQASASRGPTQAGLLAIGLMKLPTPAAEVFCAALRRAKVGRSGSGGFRRRSCGPSGDIPGLRCPRCAA